MLTVLGIVSITITMSFAGSVIGAIAAPVRGVYCFAPVIWALVGAIVGAVFGAAVGATVLA
jgi:hypothetical protein